MKQIEILSTEPMKVMFFSQKLDEEGIAFKLFDKAAGVYQEPVSSFEVSENDYDRAIKILDSIDNQKPESTSDQGGNKSLNFFRGKIFNSALVIIALGTLIFLLGYMVQQTVNGELDNSAWIEVSVLVGFIGLLFVMLNKSLKG